MQHDMRKPALTTLICDETWRDRSCLLSYHHRRRHNWQIVMASVFLTLRLHAMVDGSPTA